VAGGRSTDRAWARSLDEADPLAPLRSEFCIPPGPGGEPQVYLVGNSLGLPTTSTRHYVDAELDRWALLGVAGHTVGELAWAPYHELLTEQLARIVGAKPDEVVAMNSLTVNLHLLLVSFYRPTPQRHKILIEDHAFPSDHFAVESQIRQRGFDVATSLELVAPRPGSETLRPADILAAIERCGSELALVVLPGVQYYTGQVLPMAQITEAAHAQGALAGFDLAHAAGNIVLDLHRWGVDFAVWCSYKYLNGGPGGVGGCFVHNRHVGDQSLPKLLGWWGTRAEGRFEMSTRFEAIPTVESWQLSNAPILPMAALRASLDVIDRAGGMKVLRRKSEQQIAYLDHLLGEVIGRRATSITPEPLADRGCQLALQVAGGGPTGQAVHAQLEGRGVTCDWRYPNVIRAAPVPLYNSFDDIWRFVSILDEVLG
jgi:kynureninase